MNVVEDLMKFKEMRRATVYITPKLVVKASRMHKHDNRRKSHTFVVTMGAPNYAEREFIKRCKKAGNKLPCTTLYQVWPSKKK